MSDSMTESLAEQHVSFDTLIDLLERRAEEQPSEAAFSFLFDDGRETLVTYRELDRQARAIAASLARAVDAGERALLLYPAGLDFIAAFFGCLYAGVLAVPTTYPRPKRPSPRLASIAADAQAAVVLTNRQTLRALDIPRAAPQLADLTWIATDAVPRGIEHNWQRPDIDRDQVAFLQYTSGSTSQPKGVVVSHGNLLHNLEMIRRGFRVQPHDSGVFWLPAYHDMGLIGGILTPLYAGGHSLLMAPTTFLQRPFRWLSAISELEATISGAPNFAFDLCIKKIHEEQRRQLDLTSWKIAFCGAEPIRPETLEEFAEAFADCGFRSNAFYPCYGLAEGTLLAAGGDGPGELRVTRVDQEALAQNRVQDPASDDRKSVRRLVGCGNALLDQELIIVDPETRTRITDERVGEIWVRGESIAQGYWNRPEETEAAFRAFLADTGEGPYLRTGDYGFLRHGELYCVGRLKDMIIIRGRNHFPQDIERVVEEAHPALRPGAAGAFSIEVDGEEKLVIINELDRRTDESLHAEVLRAMRRAVIEEQEVEVYAAVLIRHGSLPRTTSGKVQRHLCRDRFLAGKLQVEGEWKLGGSQPRNGQRPHPLAGESGSEVQHVTVDQRGTRIQREKLSRSRPQPTPQEIGRLTDEIETWLLEWLVQQAGVPRAEIDRERPFAEYGLDSLTAVQLSQELEDWLGVQLTAVVAWNYPTPVAMARYLAKAACGVAEAPEAPPEEAPQSDDEFEQLLAEIENLSDDEAEAALSQKDQPG